MGTSGCKAVVFDENWDAISSSFREYDLHFPGNGMLELDAELVWDNIKRCVADVNADTGGVAGALAVSAIGDVIIPLGRDGCQRRYSIVDFDLRGMDELAEFARGFGEKRLFDITGMPPLYINSLAKILWLKRHEPDAFHTASRFATYEDFIIGRLGLDPVVSYSEAARTMLFDLKGFRWSDEIAGAIPIGIGTLATPKPSGTVLGLLSGGMRHELGFKSDVHVASGGHDMICSAVGSGFDENEAGAAVDIIGTIEGVVAALDSPATTAEMLKNKLPVYYAYGRYVTFTVNLTAGCIVRWFRDNLARSGGGFYEQMRAGINPAKPCGLLMLPHFSGSGNPHFLPDAKGTLYGMTLDTTRGDVLNSIIESLCYEQRLHLDVLRGAGVKVDKLYAAGGGAKSDNELQLKANITGATIVKGRSTEAAALGAAAYAGCALGVISNPAYAYKNDGQKTFVPDESARRLFDAQYQKYKKLSDSIYGFETHD